MPSKKKITAALTLLAAIVAFLLQMAESLPDAPAPAYPPLPASEFPAVPADAGADAR